jgi:PTH1 family peptidyl-tRNA hydrolase
VRGGIGHIRGKEGEAGRSSVVGHVLGAFKGTDAEDAAILVEKCADAVEVLLKDGLEKAQMKFHTR